MIYSQSDTTVLGGLTLLTWQSFDFSKRSLSTRAGKATFIPATYLALFRLRHVAPAEWERGDTCAFVPSRARKGCCRGFIRIKSLGHCREDLAAAILSQPPALQTTRPSLQPEFGLGFWGRDCPTPSLFPSLRPWSQWLLPWFPHGASHHSCPSSCIQGGEV